MFYRPVVLGASIEALPEERLGEGNRDKPSSWLQAATNLGEEQRRRESIEAIITILVAKTHTIIIPTTSFSYQQSYPPYEKSDVMLNYLRAAGSFICLITV